MINVKTADLIGPALDWAVAQVCVAEGSVSIDPQDAQSRLPYVTFDAAGPWIWGAGREQRGTVNKETGKPWVFHGPGGRFEPSTDWGQGGPLIEEHQIGLDWNGVDGTAMWWLATHQDIAAPQIGDTPLIAACRAIVAAKLGDEVQVPAELVQGGAT